MGLEKIAFSSTDQPNSLSSLITPPLSTQNLPDADQQLEDATSGVGILSLGQNGPVPDSAGSSIPPITALTVKALPVMNGAGYLPPTVPAIPSLPNQRPASAASVPSPLHELHEGSQQMQSPGRPHSAMSGPHWPPRPSGTGLFDLPRAGLSYVDSLEQRYSPKS